MQDKNTQSRHCKVELLEVRTVGIIKLKITQSDRKNHPPAIKLEISPTISAIQTQESKETACSIIYIEI